jgi:hypothetical protein
MIKNCLLASLLFAAPAAGFAAEAPKPTVRICASWINRKAGHCLNDFESHTLPGNVLYGITELPEGEAIAALQHSWNGAAPDRMIKLEKGRVLVSQLKGGPGEGKTVTFKVTAPDGDVLADRSVDVRWQEGRMVAQETDPGKPLVPEAVADPERPVPPRTGTATEAPLAATGGMTSAFRLRRGEVQAAYLWEESGKGALSLIPSWNPEWRWREGIGFGARVGGTFWEDRHDESFVAFEGDVHATIPVRLGIHSLDIQPALGLHWWSGRGFGVSPGLVANVQFARLPFTVVAGFHVWNQNDSGQRLFTLGFGREI